MKKIGLGVDIGGSHITCQLFDLEQNRLIENTKIRTQVDGNGSESSILDAWEGALYKAISIISRKELTGIGFAMPGPFDYKKGIAWFDKNVGKFHSLHGVDVKSELLLRLHMQPDFPLRFLNDAACFAIGEAHVESVSHFNRILVLTLGTGFGSTFLDKRLPVAGKHGIPDDGFLYHIPFKKGIADEYFSTRWFVREYKRLTGEKISGVKDLVECFETNEIAQKLFRKFGINLGEFLSPWLQNFNAECLILGGNISKSMALFVPEMEKEFRAKNIEVEICQSVLAENAALIGSVKLCDDIFYAKLTN